MDTCLWCAVVKLDKITKNGGTSVFEMTAKDLALNFFFTFTRFAIISISMKRKCDVPLENKWELDAIDIHRHNVSKQNGSSLTCSFDLR